MKFQMGTRFLGTFFLDLTKRKATLYAGFFTVALVVSTRKLNQCGRNEIKITTYFVRECSLSKGVLWRDTFSVQYSLKYFGIEEKDRESLMKFIGPPLKDSFMEYYR